MSKVERAQREVRRLLDAEFDFAERLIAKQRQTESAADQAAGDSVLAAMLGDGEDTSAGPFATASMDAAVKSVADVVSKARAEVVTLNAAVAAARRARCGSIMEAWRAEAAEHRAEARGLRRQADGLDRQARPHLDALKRIYNVDFVPAAQVIVANAAAGAMPSGPVVMPTTAALHQQADDLDAEAKKIEARVIREGGALTAKGDENALKAALAASPFTLAPPAHVVLAWAQTAAQAARQTWNTQLHHGKATAAQLARVPIQFSLLWEGESIKPESGAECDLRRRDENGAVI